MSLADQLLVEGIPAPEPEQIACCKLGCIYTLVRIQPLDMPRTKLQVARANAEPLVHAATT